MMERPRSSLDIIADLQHKIRILEDRVMHLENRMVVTLPEYDTTALPVGVTAVPHSIFITTDNKLAIVEGGVVLKTAALT